MKKIISILCLAVMVVGILIPAMSFAKSESTAWVKTGNGKGLNIRVSPSKEAEIIKTLPYRTQLIVHQFSGNGWALVEPADWSMSNPGWVSTSFLVYSDPGPYQKKKEDPDPVDINTTLDGVVAKIKYLEEPYDAVIKTSRPTNFVHLRWYPDTNARYIEKYLCDTEIVVLAESSKWAQVQIVEDGYVGFILKSNVEKLAD